MRKVILGIAMAVMVMAITVTQTEAASRIINTLWF